MLVIGRHEHREWHLLDADGIHDLEAVEAWHLDVEKHEIRCLLLDLADGVETVERFVHDLERGCIHEKRAHEKACRLFVIDDQRSPATRRAHGTTHARTAAAGCRSGSSTRTVVPDGRATSVRRLAPP